VGNEMALSAAPGGCVILLENILYHNKTDIENIRKRENVTKEFLFAWLRDANHFRIILLH
jgi:hypothetical protein